MTGIGNNFGPRSAMGADLAKQVKDLGKLDEGKALGEVQQANADRSEGETTLNAVWNGGNANGEDQTGKRPPRGAQAGDVVIFARKNNPDEIYRVIVNDKGELEMIAGNIYPSDFDPNRGDFHNK